MKSGAVSIDASFIEAKQRHPKRGKEGQDTQDPAASRDVKVGSDGKRQSSYGYKAHVNVDEDGFIKATDYSPSSLHDSSCFPGLFTGEESAADGDSALSKFSPR